MLIPNVGDRVKMIGVMPDEPAPLPVGTEGTVTTVTGSGEYTQIFVEWDIERSLILLPTDPFAVISHG